MISQRRTREEWNLLIAMHRGWYPLVDNQAFRRGGPPPRDAVADGRPPDTRHPVEKAVDHLAQSVPAEDPGVGGVVGDDAAGAARRDVGDCARPKLGKGAVVWPDGRDAGRRPRRRVHDRDHVDLCAHRRACHADGPAIVYTGFQWRGRSTPTRRRPPSDVDPALREVMFVDRDWRTIEGRWFTGGYDELGLDVRLERVGAEPRVLGTDRTALRAGATGAIVAASTAPIFRPRFRPRRSISVQASR